MENFTLTAKLLSEREEFEQTEEIIVIPKKYSVFIQTDKAVYKPGDEVLYRILILDPDRKPYHGECINVIYDAKGKLKATKNVSLQFFRFLV